MCSKIKAASPWALKFLAKIKKDRGPRPATSLQFSNQTYQGSTQLKIQIGLRTTREAWRVKWCQYPTNIAYIANNGATSKGSTSMEASKWATRWWALAGLSGRAAPSSLRLAAETSSSSRPWIPAEEQKKLCCRRVVALLTSTITRCLRSWLAMIISQQVLISLAANMTCFHRVPETFAAIDIR